MRSTKQRALVCACCTRGLMAVLWERASGRSHAVQARGTAWALGAERWGRGVGLQEEGSETQWDQFLGSAQGQWPRDLSFGSGGNPDGPYPTRVPSPHLAALPHVFPGACPALATNSSQRSASLLLLPRTRGGASQGPPGSLKIHLLAPEPLTPRVASPPSLGLSHEGQVGCPRGGRRSPRGGAPPPLPPPPTPLPSVTPKPYGKPIHAPPGSVLGPDCPPSAPHSAK